MTCKKIKTTRKKQQKKYVKTSRLFISLWLIEFVLGKRNKIKGLSFRNRKSFKNYKQVFARAKPI